MLGTITISYTTATTKYTDAFESLFMQEKCFSKNAYDF